VHGQVDHHADIRHPRRERPDPRDRDRQNVLARDRLLDRGHCRIEAFDMTDHQRHAGTGGGGDDLLPFLHGRCDRLFDQDVNVVRDTGQRDLVVQMRRCGDGDGIDAFRDQFIEAGERAAADQFGGPRTMFRQRIDDPDQCRIRQTGQHAGMIAAMMPAPMTPMRSARLASAFTADAEPLETIECNPRIIRRHGPTAPHLGLSLARRHRCGECGITNPNTF